MNVKMDGTFNNTKVFKGEYGITPSGAFVPLEEERIKISGTVEKTWEVEPLLRVEWVGEPVVNADGTVDVKVKVSRGTDNPDYQEALAEAWLFVSENMYVGDFSYSPNYSTRISGAAIGMVQFDQVYTIRTGQPGGYNPAGTYTPFPAFFAEVFPAVRRADDAAVRRYQPLQLHDCQGDYHNCPLVRFRMPGSGDVLSPELRRPIRKNFTDTMISNDMERYAVGADIGGSHICSAVVDLTTVKSAESLSPARSIATPAPGEILGAWADNIRQSIAASGLKAVRRVGFAFPGPFDYEHGVSLIRGVNKLSGSTDSTFRSRFPAAAAVRSRRVPAMSTTLRPLRWASVSAARRAMPGAWWRSRSEQASGRVSYPTVNW